MDIEQRLTAAAPGIRAELWEGPSAALAGEIARTGPAPRRRWSRGWTASVLGPLVAAEPIT